MESNTDLGQIAVPGDTNVEDILPAFNGTSILGLSRHGGKVLLTVSSEYTEQVRAKLRQAGVDANIKPIVATNMCDTLPNSEQELPTPSPITAEGKSVETVEEELNRRRRERLEESPGLDQKASRDISLWKSANFSFSLDTDAGIFLGLVNSDLVSSSKFGSTENNLIVPSVNIEKVKKYLEKNGVEFSMREEVMES
ncbi:hypothetical protein JKY72_02540 [Candidatus Gracilibacteria bacterium]|nr:hypothetical protein [Candidatus Gracilibacteria bacterium]